MASVAFLREDIKEVFSIFDEDGSGVISMQDVGRALYTITGQRVARSELLKLIAFAQNAVAKLHQAQQNQQGQMASHEHAETMSAESRPSQPGVTMADGEVTSFSGSLRPSSQAGTSISASSVRIVSPITERAAAATGAAAVASTTSSTAAAARSQNRFVSPHSHLLDSSEGIDLDVFEQIVLRKLKHRSYEEELAYTFALLEDKSYLGFITKESMRRAAAETGESLTEAEIAEMFDPLVTGVSTAAVDLSTFTDLQLKARKAEDS